MTVFVLCTGIIVRKRQIILANITDNSLDTDGPLLDAVIQYKLWVHYFNRSKFSAWSFTPLLITL